MRPGETENHWFDCLVGNGVAASMLGARIGGRLKTAEKQATPPRTTVNLTGPDGRPFFLTAR